MADLTITAAAFRVVQHDPEDVLEFNARSGYTPAYGDLVAVSGADEVALADATSGDNRNVIAGVVIGIRRTQNNAGYAVSVLERGTIEGFTGLSAPGFIYNSVTAGKMGTTDPTVAGQVGRVVGYIKAATRIRLCCPALPGQGGES